MSILKEQAANGHHNVFFFYYVPFLQQYRDQMDWLNLLADWLHPPADRLHIINRPSVAGAVLHSPPSFIDSLIHSAIN